MNSKRFVLAGLALLIATPCAAQESLVTYKSLSGSDWDALGAKDPELKEGDYKLQVGDLNNRTSLQFIDPKGKPLTQSQNDGLVAAFQAAFSKTSVN